MSGHVGLRRRGQFRLGPEGIGRRAAGEHKKDHQDAWAAKTHLPFSARGCRLRGGRESERRRLSRIIVCPPRSLASHRSARARSSSANRSARAEPPFRTRACAFLPLAVANGRAMTSHSSLHRPGGRRLEDPSAERGVWLWHLQVSQARASSRAVA